ncbi:MAG: hypothetical protein FWC09_01320 [Lachnospiraceae bacterium]|nr:hypothetical protein [Lachnospiraceae bacterium]
MKKILCINKNPFVRLYPTYAFSETVINNELTTGNRLASVLISDYRQKKWEKNLDGSTIEIKDNLIDIYLIDPYSNNSSVKIFRQCSEDDEIIVNIEHQLITKPWDNICIFINLKNEDDSIEDIYSMGKFYGFGFYTSQPNENQSFEEKRYRNKKLNWMKISKINNEKIIYYISSNGLTWETLYSCDINTNEYYKYHIGLEITYSGNQFYNWLFSNFIQLCGGTASQSQPVMYCAYPHKSYDFYPLNPFINILMEQTDIFKVYGFSLWEYIIININKGRYLEFFLEEIFIPKTNAYKNGHNYVHQNLIYGYDDEKKELNIINFYGGKQIYLTVAYKDFEKAFKFSDNDYIYIYEYYVNKVGYNMNLERIYNMIQHYLSGEDYIKMGLGMFSEPVDLVYGIKLYDDYIKDQKSIDILLNDSLISYIFYEHKKIMQERIKYLIAGQVVAENEVKEIRLNIDEIVNLSAKMMNLILKNRIKEIVDFNEKIVCLVKLIKNKEIYTYTRLLKILKSKL